MWSILKNSHARPVNTKPTFDALIRELTTALQKQWQPTNPQRAHVRRMDVDSLRTFVAKFCEDYRGRLEQ